LTLGLRAIGVFELRGDCPKDYLFLFEAIFNSKLAEFYIEVKYRLREEGNPKIDIRNTSD